MAARMRREERQPAEDMMDEGVIVPQAAGDPNAVPQEIKGQWDIHDFDQEDWSDIIEDIGADPDYCFLCAICQNNTELAGNPNLKMFVNFMVENYAKMTRKTLAVMARSIYNQLLRGLTISVSWMRLSNCRDAKNKTQCEQQHSGDYLNETLYAARPVSWRVHRGGSGCKLHG